MIYYDQLPLSQDILQSLAELKIDYVFQPIFYPDGKTIYAYGALMRPVGMNVMDLIDEYTKLDKLHVLEVATFWGATEAYFLRGYKEKLSINSFPCECFTPEELETYREYFGKDENVLIIENLEYPHIDMEKSLKKRKIADVGLSEFALDDYGVGINDIGLVESLDPQIVKIDRSLLSGIDSNEEKQDNCRNIIETMHKIGKKVVVEGVETKEEFDYLVLLGADLFQGYYLGRPM